MIAAVLAGLLVFAGLLAVRAVVRAGRRQELRRRLDRAAGVRLLAPPARVAERLEDAALPFPPAACWTGWCGAGALGVPAAALVGGAGLGLVVALAVAGGPALVLAARRGRAVQELETALPDALDAVARSLRSGAVLRDAIAEAAGAGRLGVELRRVVDDADRGVPLVVAVDSWAGWIPAPGVRLTAAALALAAEGGGAAARAVDGVAATLRANQAVAHEVRAQSSQARTSGLVIALAPLAFGLLAAGLDGRTAEFLLRTPVGVACLAAGLLLDGLGAWWMHRITAVAGGAT